jgi:hypothetical protein
MRDNSLHNNPTYAPEIYGYIDKILERFAGIDNAEVLSAAREAYAAERRACAQRVFAPGLLPDVGPILALSSGSPNQRVIDLIWRRPDGTLCSDLHIVDDPSPGLIDIVRDLGATFFEKGYQANGALSAYSSWGNDRVANLVARCWGVIERRVDLYWEYDYKLNRAFYAFRSTLTKFERRRLSASLKKFRQHLDPEALKIMHQTGFLRISDYNWLQGDGDRTRRLYRMQAASDYPLFLGYMRKRDDVTDKIDGGESVARILAGTKGAETIVRRMRKLHWQRAGSQARRSPHSLMLKLQDIPGNWIPRSKAEFRAFDFVMGHPVDALAQALGRDRKDVISQLGGKWIKMSELFLRVPPQGIQDLTRDFCNKVIAPYLAQQVLEAVGRTELAEAALSADSGLMAFLYDVAHDRRLRDAFFGDCGIQKVLAATDRWHHALPRLQECLNDGDPDESTRWAALSDDFADRSGIRIVSLTSERELRDEGARMDHCVGGYAYSCLHHSHILSLRDPQGGRLSTAELVETGNPKQPLRINQHFGPRNSPPPEKARRALDAFLRHLSKPEHRPDWAQIERRRDEVRREFEARSGGIGAIVGYDPFDRKKSRHAFEMYKEFMPGPGRKQNLEEFLEKTGLIHKIDAYAVARIMVDLKDRREGIDESALKTSHLRPIDPADAGRDSGTGAAIRGRRREVDMERDRAHARDFVRNLPRNYCESRNEGRLAEEPPARLDLRTLAERVTRMIRRREAEIADAEIPF